MDILHFAIAAKIQFAKVADVKTEHQPVQHTIIYHVGVNVPAVGL